MGSNCALKRLFPGATALHLAVLNGFSSVAAMLVSKGADVTACDAMGKAPLHYAGICHSLSKKEHTLCL